MRWNNINLWHVVCIQVSLCVSLCVWLCLCLWRLKLFTTKSFGFCDLLLMANVIFSLPLTSSSPETVRTPWMPPDENPWCTVTCSNKSKLLSVMLGGAGRGRRLLKLARLRDMWLRLSETYAPFLARNKYRVVRFASISLQEFGP